MKFYERPEFMDLNRKWKKKLERSGFKDIEKPNEELQQHDRRTKRWERREQVLEFFLSLDEFMRHNRLPRKDRRILDLYSRGIIMKEISVEVGVSYAWVKHIVAKYEKIILELY